MATTQYTTSSNETWKLWGRKLLREVLKHVSYAPFIGKDSNSLVMIKDELSKNPGDRVRCTLRMQLTGDGVQGDTSLEGNEESLTTYTQDLVINQLRHAVRSDGRMTDQRVAFSVREEARLGLEDWHKDRMDTAFFNQLCGNNAQTDTKFTGHNSTSAPDASHQIWSESGVSNDQSLTSAGTLSLTTIDTCIELAQTSTPAIRPLRFMGEECYVLFCHPAQITSLRTSTDSGQWLDITKAVYEGRGDNNPITKGFIGSSSRVVGKYNSTYIISNSRVTQGVNSSTAAAVANTRRAVFCGAQAAVLAFGRGYSAEAMEWVEEEFDYGNQLGVAAGCISGLIATRYNSADFAKIVVSSYSSS